MAMIAAEGYGEVLDTGDAAARLADMEVFIVLDRHQQAALPHAQLTDPVTGEILCWECEKPICAERLAVFPMAAFCVPCLERIEDQRRLFAEGKRL